MAYVKAKTDSDVELSSVFVDKYMLNADGNFVKVYILGLRQCGNEKHMNNKEIANALQLLESDVIKAWHYWERMGAVKIITKPDGEFNVEFQDLNARSAPAEYTSTKPVYTPDEIYTYVSGSKELKEMFTMSERILSKPLSSTDIIVLYSLYDYYRLPMDVIPLLLTYCIKNGKKSMRQIEKIAQTWVDREINTAHKAEVYLKRAEEYNSQINNLKKAMGIYDRKFTPTELNYVNNWLENMYISVELIAFAFDIAVVNTGKLSVQYMNTILQDWYSKGIKTPAQANEYRRDFKKKNEKADSGGGNVKPTKFSNFKQPKFDFKAIEARALGKHKGSDL